MYVTPVAELDMALADCWRRLTQARDLENVEACEVYLAQLDRLLDMRLQLRQEDPAAPAVPTATGRINPSVAGVA